MECESKRKLRVVALGVVLLMGIALPGCGNKPLEGPPTVPVKGKVVFTKNGTLEPIVDRQGAVEFESVDQPGVKALGDIQPDGSFTVSTLVTGGAKPGAVPGQHRVRLYLDERAQQFVAPKFLRFDKSGIAVTVTEPQSDVEIQIWR
jgi:hypothetical protein